MNICIAAQMGLLGRLLPVLIAEDIPLCDEYWQNFLLLREIIDFILAPELLEDEVPYLQLLIGEHHYKGAVAIGNHCFLNQHNFFITKGMTLFFIYLCTELNYLSNDIIRCGFVVVVYTSYVTGFGKRDLIAQIMIFLYRRFSATTPKNNSRDKTFVFVSEVSPTLCLHLR